MVTSPAPRARRGRPPTITRERLVAAGIELTLERLTLTGVAAALGVTVAAIRNHVDGIDDLRRMVAEEILARRPIHEVRGDDLVTDLLRMSTELAALVHDHPGIALYLARVDSRAIGVLAAIDANHAAYAEAYDLSPTQAAWLASTVAEHAIALAELVHTRNPRPRDGKAAIDARTDLVNLPLVEIRRPDRTEAELFEWSMRATAIGAVSLIGELP